MGGNKEIYQDGIVTRQVQWVLMEAENDHDCESELIDSDFEECSDDSVDSESSTSSDLVEDASSSSSSSSSLSSTSSSSCGPLYELSELMAQLPIKRGLSKYYQGESQSFKSLANVKSLEDLAKKGDFMSYNKRMKGSKSFGDSQRYGPKPTIAKKKTCSRARRESSNLVGSLIRSSVQKHF